MPIQRDEAYSSGRSRVLDRGPLASMSTKYNPVGEVYYKSGIGFRGYDGWRPVHVTGFMPTPPVGLTNHPVDSDHDSMALNLSTGERTYVSTNFDNECATFRSISTYTPKRFLKYSAKLALSDGGFNLSWSSFGLAFDIQKADNSSRSFPKLYCRYRQGSTDFTGWAIVNDAGAEVVLPSTANHIIPGANENKMGYGYVALVWDRQANGGLGGYHEAQIQDQLFDLTGLGAGHANTAVQASGTQIDDYNAGLNLGLFVDRSNVAGQENTYPAGLRVCDITLTGHDVA